MSTAETYQTRVLWEGEVLESKDHADYDHIAWAHFGSTEDKYRRMDAIEGGVTVQLIHGDYILAERHFDEYGMEF